MNPKPLSRLDKLRAELAQAEAKLKAVVHKSPGYSGKWHHEVMRLEAALKREELAAAKGAAR